MKFPRLWTSTKKLHLLHYFTLTSLVAFTVVVVVLGLVQRNIALNNMIAVAQENNVNLTRTIANSLWADFRPFADAAGSLDVEALRAAPEQAQVLETVANLTVGVPVLKVKIFNMDALTVFSSQASQIGDSKKGYIGFDKASKGITFSELSDREKFVGIHETVEHRKVLSSYIPIADTTTGKTVGVVEIYSDITPVMTSIVAKTWIMVGAVVIALLSLYIALFFIVRRADKVIRDQGARNDELAAERAEGLARAEEENEKLNDSIVKLLQAVAQLSRRDLTVKVPVSEDVTGLVADSLNLLTSETAKVLRGISTVARDVAAASNEVKMRSDAVLITAEEERVVVVTATDDLSQASLAMLEIARLAQACNEAAEHAIETTAKAEGTVLGTVTGINGIRDNIRDTAKRIKRLGEHSQEISGVVSLINNIAERTHILALNASMHAAAAGEAGRGFAVVADEVQRLAANAREATSQISAMVNKIQVETADTVTAMNDATSKVVSGSSLAEQAGDEMRRTRESTASLVELVQHIASGSQIQAKVSQGLSERADGLRRSTEQTTERLKEQTEHTSRLVASSQALTEAVSVFKLPVEGTVTPIPRPTSNTAKENSGAAAAFGLASNA